MALILLCMHRKVQFFSLPSLFKQMKLCLWNHLALCPCVYRPVVARQRLDKGNLAATNTHAIKKNVGRVLFCALLVSSKDSRRLFLSRASFVFHLLILHDDLLLFLSSSTQISTGTPAKLSLVSRLSSVSPGKLQDSKSIRPGPLPSRFLPVHSWSIILPSDASE
jgi:hypothetical protein